MRNFILGILLSIVALGSAGALALEHLGASAPATRQMAASVWTVAVELLGFEMVGREMDFAPGAVSPQSVPQDSRKTAPPAQRPGHHRLRDFVRQANGSAGAPLIDTEETHPVVE